MIPADLEIVRIRYLEPRDHAAYVALEKDQEIKRYVSGPSEKTDEMLFGDLRRYRPSMDILAMAYPASDVFIGRCGFLVDTLAQEGEIYCLLLKNWQRKGIGRVVVPFLVQLVRNSGLRAVGYVDPGNRPSLALMSSLGMTADGTKIGGKQDGHIRYVLDVTV